MPSPPWIVTSPCAVPTDPTPSAPILTPGRRCAVFTRRSSGYHRMCRPTPCMPTIWRRPSWRQAPTLRAGPDGSSPNPSGNGVDRRPPGCSAHRQRTQCRRGRSRPLTVAGSASPAATTWSGSRSLTSIRAARCSRVRRRARPPGEDSGSSPPSLSGATTSTPAARSLGRDRHLVTNGSFYDGWPIVAMKSCVIRISLICMRMASLGVTSTPAPGGYRPLARGDEIG